MVHCSGRHCIGLLVLADVLSVAVAVALQIAKTEGEGGAVSGFCILMISLLRIAWQSGCDAGVCSDARCFVWLPPFGRACDRAGHGQIEPGETKAVTKLLSRGAVRGWLPYSTHSILAKERVAELELEQELELELKEGQAG
jgi:hypothetical protein